MEEIDLTCEGRANIFEAMLLAKRQIRQFEERLGQAGYRMSAPLVLLLSDCDDTVARDVGLVAESSRNSRYATEFLLLTCEGNHEENAAQLCPGRSAGSLALRDFSLWGFISIAIEQLLTPCCAPDEQAELVPLGIPYTAATDAPLPPDMSGWLLD